MSTMFYILTMHNLGSYFCTTMYAIALAKTI